MLVIDYSCGIKLSTATAFSAAINTAVRKGVLIKGGAYIEQMSNANTVLLDKTGTITEGRPQVVSMRMYAHDMDERAALSLAMAAEETSAHPLASAILAYGRKLGAEIPAHGETVTEVSRGSSTEVDGRVVRVGNLRYMAENGVRAEEAIKPIEGRHCDLCGRGQAHHRGALRHGQAARERAPCHQQPALRRRGRYRTALPAIWSHRRALWPSW